MATAASSTRATRGGRARGARGGPARPQSHQSRPRHTGLVNGRADCYDADEISVLERIAHKFCHKLHGHFRQEAVGSATARGGERLPGEDEWFVVTMQEDQQLDTNETWRRMRERLEAVSVLSVLACTESYALRRNISFWCRFTQADGRSTHRDGPNAGRPKWKVDAIPAPRDDAIMPRFMLDFSFAEITTDVLALLRHVLMGSAKSMRKSFKHAMETLATIPLRKPRAATISIALRFARCRFTGAGVMRKVVELVQVVNLARSERHRELSNVTSKRFYYEVIELDLSGIRLATSDLLQLRLLSTWLHRQGGFRLVLDNALDTSPDHIVAFGSLVASWFGPSLQVQSEPEPEAPICITPAIVTGTTCISLRSSALSPYHVASLFSAIREPGPGGATSRVSLRGAFQCCGPEVAWAWIACGVCCGSSFSTLESLDVSGNVLNLDAAAVVRQVVTTSDHRTQLQFLYGLVAGLTATATINQTSKKSKQKRRTGRRAAGGTKNESTSYPLWVRLDPGTRLSLSLAGKITSLALTSGTIVRVVDVRPSGAAIVLFPGYGFLEVDLATAASCDDFVEDIADEQRLQELKLNSMVIAEDAHTPDAVLASLFSSLSLTALTHLELNENPLGENTLRAVVEACPVLHSLSMEDCELTSIGPIIDAYSRNDCHIQSLHLGGNEIGDRDIVGLARLIARGLSPASQLRVLDLHQNPITHRGLTSLSVAIRESPNALVHLVLDREQDLEMQCRAMFYPFHDQFLGSEPLSPVHQREFYAALSRRLHTTALEPSILDLIYAYAASPLHRRILWR